MVRSRSPWSSSVLSTQGRPRIDVLRVSEGGGRRILTRPVKPICQLRSPIENKSGHHEPYRPKKGEENAQGTRQRFDGRQHRRVKKHDRYYQALQYSQKYSFKKISAAQQL